MSPDVQIQQAGVPIAPVPTSFDLGEARVGDEQLVVIRAHTPLGVQLYFVPPETAEQLGELLRAAAQKRPHVVIAR